MKEKHFRIELATADVSDSVLMRKMHHVSISDYPDTIYKICADDMHTETIGEFDCDSREDAIRSFREEAAQEVSNCGGFYHLSTVILVEGDDDDPFLDTVDSAEMSQDDCLELWKELFGGRIDLDRLKELYDYMGRDISEIVDDFTNDFLSLGEYGNDGEIYYWYFDGDLEGIINPETGELSRDSKELGFI